MACQCHIPLLQPCGKRFPCLPRVLTGVAFFPVGAARACDSDPTKLLPPVQRHFRGQTEQCAAGQFNSGWQERLRDWVVSCFASRTRHQEAMEPTEMRPACPFSNVANTTAVQCFYTARHGNQSKYTACISRSSTYLRKFYVAPACHCVDAIYEPLLRRPRVNSRRARSHGRCHLHKRSRR